MRLLSAFMIVCCLTSALMAQDANEPTTQPGKKLAHPSFAEVKDDPKLPRVLLLGDSISMGYMLDVRKLLAGKANVHRPAENCGETARGLKQLDTWLGDGKWDVIHFNFGLHDLKYVDAKGTYVTPDKGKQVTPLAEYEKNLRELVARLKKTNAKLIWCSTTPVPAGAAGRLEGDEIKFNEVAAKVMKDNNIPIDDLHSVAMPQLAKIQQRKNVHFSEAGSAILAKAVAEKISEALPK